MDSSSDKSKLVMKWAPYKRTNTSLASPHFNVTTAMLTSKVFQRICDSPTLMVLTICVMPETPFSRVTLTNLVSGSLMKAQTARAFSMTPANIIAVCTDQKAAIATLAKYAQRLLFS